MQETVGSSLQCGLQGSGQVQEDGYQGSTPLSQGLGKYPTGVSKVEEFGRIWV